MQERHRSASSVSSQVQFIRRDAVQTLNQTCYLHRRVTSNGIYVSHIIFNFLVATFKKRQKPDGINFNTMYVCMYVA